jgi:hypothetical protein
VHGKHKRKKQRQSTTPEDKRPIKARIDQEMTTETNHTDNREKNKGNPQSFVKLFKTDQRFRVEVLVLGAALIVAAIYFCQLRVMQRQFDLTEQSIHSGQRAYLVFHHPELDETPTADKEITATVELTNSGQTPATNVIASLNMFPSRTCPPSGMPYGPAMSLAPIGASHTDRPFAITRLRPEEAAEVITEEIAIPAANKLEIATGKLRLCFIGIAQYRDIFGNPGEATFCAAYGRKKFIACLAPNSTTIK